MHDRLQLRSPRISDNVISVLLIAEVFLFINWSGIRFSVSVHIRRFNSKTFICVALVGDKNGPNYITGVSYDRFQHKNISFICTR